MISPASACLSQAEGGRNRAAVCSMPPSEVGVGIIASWVEGRFVVLDEDCDDDDDEGCSCASGRK